MYDMFYFYDIKKENRQFDSVKERFPLIKTIKYDDNRYEALSRAKRISTTKMFWIIDLDNDYVINDNFNFDYIMSEWDKIYVHIWQTSKKEFSSVYLISKDYPFTNREADHLFFINKKEISIEASRYGYDILRIDFNDNVYNRIIEFQKKARTSMFWVLAPECKLLNDLTYVVPDYDKEYVHQWTPINQDSPNLFLIPSNYPISKKETDYLFFISKKIMDEKISKVGYDILHLTLNDNIYEKITSFRSTTSMFWVLAPECKLLNDLTYVVPDYDKEYVHQWIPINHELPNLFLIPKDYPISKREAEHLFFISKKEMDEKISKVGYDILHLTLNDNIYEKITSFQPTTSMFWVLPMDCKLITELTYLVPDYDKEYVHQWTASNTDHLRLNLIPKDYPMIRREVENLFFISKKTMLDNICKEEYDIIFISYNEPNADINWKNLIDRFPRAKRVHGIKGIHNAHIRAAQIAETTMFWAIDGDAQLEENFNLDYVVDPWDKDSVFVWKSKNPINNLVYGYGGVKLLPKLLTLNLDISTVDMTTSISNKFNPKTEISNITAFNTDPFNTWKSAFRECVKLSSKSIDGQIDQETIDRLYIWCTIGADNLYGEYSIKGATAGREFGLKYSNNKSMLSKINDWEWLTGEFNKL